jgi:hypothetical protein
MKSECLIYGLKDPFTNEIRYVGKSSWGIKRARDHLKPSHVAKETNSHKANWLRIVYANGGRPEVVFLEGSTPESLNDDERKWIAYGRSHGWRLTNIKDGGDGGPLPDSTRRKISERLTGHPVPQSARDAVARSNRLRTPYVRTEAIRQRSRISQLGKKFSDTHLTNLREAVRKREERRRSMKEITPSQ